MYRMCAPSLTTPCDVCEPDGDSLKNGVALSSRIPSAASPVQAMGGYQADGRSSAACWAGNTTSAGKRQARCGQPSELEGCRSDRSGLTRRGAEGYTRLCRTQRSRLPSHPASPNAPAHPAAFPGRSSGVRHAALNLRSFETSMTDDGTHDIRGVQQEPAPLAAAVPHARQPPCCAKPYASNRGAPMWGLARGTAAYVCQSAAAGRR